MAGKLARTIMLCGVLGGFALAAQAQQAQPPQGDKTVEDGKYATKDGVPTYNVGPDGTVDWFTFSGFRRYHSDCHVCHGPDGLGSTYAPALTESVKRLSYEEFQSVIANGRQVAGAGGNSVMPAFGTNRNVMCYLDDIWIYLRARSDEAVQRGRPAKREAQPQANKDYEKACMEG